MPSAIVSGGSLGGLLAATALKDLGYRITVFERSRSLESQGAGIVCGGRTSEFFERFDKTRTPLSVPSLRRQYLGRDGKIKHLENSRQEMTSWDKLYYVLRANFDGFIRPNYHLGQGISGSPSSSDANSIYLIDHKVQSHTYDAKTGRVRVSYQNAEGRDGVTEADILICAEGASSTIRKTYAPDVEVKYAGYLAFRGLVHEQELSAETAKLFISNFNFFHGPATQFLCYTIPGPNGSLEPGSRHLNWVWYVNYPAGSSELTRVTTDNEGVRHPHSIRAGELPDDVVRKDIYEKAKADLPPPCVKVVTKTKEPFLQLINDTISTAAVYADGHVVLVGDAVCGPRPHTAASTNQAADHALRLHEVMSSMPCSDRTGLKELTTKWEPETLINARQLSSSGKALGNRSQFLHHPLSDE